MKLNKKGFTLIELLAVVIVLGLVMVIVFPNSIDIFKNTKLKTEEAFLDRLSQSIESYIELNTDQLTFDDYGTVKKSGETLNVKSATKTINDVISSDIIRQSDFVNPNNKEVSCYVNATIEIYKDSDYVYCHKVKASDLGCLTEDYKNKLKDNPYAIDTCIWTMDTEEE